MSTKSTLKFEMDEATGQLAHLYQDVFDEEHVFLELQDFSFELSVRGQLASPLGFPTPWPKSLAC